MSSFTPLERLLLPLVRRFVALWVRPSALPDDLDACFVPGRPVVYALGKRSVVDVAVLEYVCRERQLPMPLAPPAGPGKPRVGVLFLERRAGFFGTRVDRRTPEALRGRCLALREALRGPGPTEAVVDMLEREAAAAWA